MSGIFINSDAWNFWIAKPEQMTAEGIRADVDFYTAGGGVEAIFYNMNFQRSFYPTKVGTPYDKDLEVTGDGTLLLRGEPVTKENGADEYKMFYINYTTLKKNCPDYMQLRYDYCHEKGVEMWHSMRMNDVHHSRIGQEHRPQHCDLWQERKDLIRAWYRHSWRGEWVDGAFDYGQQEVYDYHLAMAREYLLDYESDGIELDWLRCAPVFKPGYDEINTPILTQFMRDVRAAADEAEKKWGHRLRIAVRVPGQVMDAMGMGMDVYTWAKEGLIDVLIPSPRDVCTEQDYNVTLWRQLVPAPVILAPCIDCALKAAPGYEWSFRYTTETDCGFASNYYQQGADTIYLYNHFPFQAKEHPEMQRFLSYVGDRKKVASHARRHAVTNHVQNGEGKFAGLTFPHQIWSQCCNGGVKVNVGENVAGKTAKVVIGATKPLDIDILVNTKLCPMLPKDTPLPDPVPASKDKQTWYVQAEIPAGLLHEGWNVVEIFHKGWFTLLAEELIWMEIVIDGEKG